MADAAVDGGACRAAGWRAASGARAGIRPRAWPVPVGADPTPPEAEGTSRAEASAHPRSPERREGESDGDRDSCSRRWIDTSIHPQSTLRAESLRIGC